MKYPPAFDPSNDYEPPYDLEAAHARNLHAYTTSPKFREMMDRLTAKGRADEQRRLCTRWLRAATLLRDEERPWRCWPTLDQLFAQRKKEGSQ
jgi:hypothetical protein